MSELSPFGQRIEILYSLIHSSLRPSSILWKHRCRGVGFSKIISSRNLFTQTRFIRWQINLVLLFTEHLPICLYFNAFSKSRKFVLKRSVIKMLCENTFTFTYSSHIKTYILIYYILFQSIINELKKKREKNYFLKIQYFFRINIEYEIDVG